MRFTDDTPSLLWHCYSRFSATIKTGLICAAFFNFVFGILDTALLIYNKADYPLYILPAFNIYFSLCLVVAASNREVSAVFLYISLNGILIALESILVALIGLALIFSNDDNLLGLVNLINWIYPGIGYIGGNSSTASAVCFIFIQLAISSARIVFQIIACKAFTKFMHQRPEEETPLMIGAERSNFDPSDILLFLMY